MRILALDHGTKRIGIAVSDELGVIAQPLEFIAAEPFGAFLSRLKEIIRERSRWSSCWWECPGTWMAATGRPR